MYIPKWAIKTNVNKVDSGVSVDFKTSKVWVSIMYVYYFLKCVRIKINL